jgi:hypothetical protein
MSEQPSWMKVEKPPWLTNYKFWYRPMTNGSLLKLLIVTHIIIFLMNCMLTLIPVIIAWQMEMQSAIANTPLWLMEQYGR